MINGMITLQTISLPQLSHTNIRPLISHHFQIFTFSFTSSFTPSFTFTIIITFTFTFTFTFSFLFSFPYIFSFSSLSISFNLWIQYSQYTYEFKFKKIEWPTINLQEYTILTNIIISRKTYSLGKNEMYFFKLYRAYTKHSLYFKICF